MMKKLIISFCLLLGVISLQANSISIIDGKWTGKKLQSIKLFSVDNGTLKEIASSQIAEDGAFGFAFTPSKEGFYVLGPNEKGPMYNNTFYFKAGDRLNVEVSSINYKLIGENTPENKELARWHDLILPVEESAVNYLSKSNATYVEFFPLLESTLPVLNAFEKSNTPNTLFNALFDDYRKIDVLHKALLFISTPHSAHPSASDYTQYYKNLNLSDYTKNGSLLEYPYGMSIISMYGLQYPLINSGMDEAQKKSYRDPVGMLNVILPQIEDNMIKGELVAMQSKYLKSYDNYIQYEKEYGKYIVTDSQSQRMKTVLNKLAETNTGQPAIDFKFSDMDGKEIALSDFKGKVVYIDVWATWCRPCIQEIPSLKALEEEYHGKDIIFLSVATDKSSDHTKWKNFVVNRELKGVQLFAGDRAESDLLGPYDIKGIPRFILIGKDGKIVVNDAPRPSSSGIRSLLDATLNK